MVYDGGELMNYKRTRRALAKGLVKLQMDNNYQEYKLQNLCKSLGIRLVNYKVNFTPMSHAIHPDIMGMGVPLTTLNYPNQDLTKPRGFSRVHKDKRRKFREWFNDMEEPVPSLEWDKYRIKLCHCPAVHSRCYHMYYQNKRIGKAESDISTMNRSKLHLIETYDENCNGVAIVMWTRNNKLSSQYFSITYTGITAPGDRDPELTPVQKLRKYHTMPMTSGRFTPIPSRNYLIRGLKIEHNRRLYPSHINGVIDPVTGKMCPTAEYYSTIFESDDYRKWYKTLPRDMKEFEWRIRYGN